jgi:hypothetical protein
MTHGLGSVTLGDGPVAVLRRSWGGAPAVAYRKSFRLRPGQAWHDADRSSSLRGRYALVDGEVLPVGVAIARELVASGAGWAYATEVWAGRVVLLGPDLVCAAADGAVGALLSLLRRANGSYAGLPDVVGVAGGRVVLRSARDVAARERLASPHHEFARAARRLFGDRLDLAVVEWGGPPGAEGRAGAAARPAPPRRATA